MERQLWLHPQDYCPSVDRIDVAVEHPSATLLRFRYVVRGRIAGLLLPRSAAPLRANNLWQATCFEAFLMPVGWPGYCEFNFSPSSQWAAYDFAAYREGMMQAGLPAAPEIGLDIADDRLELTAAISLDLPVDTYRIGLSAVIEEKGGAKSYWALNHPSKAPDFHHPTSFALELPAH